MDWIFSNINLQIFGIFFLKTPSDFVSEQAGFKVGGSYPVP